MRTLPIRTRLTLWYFCFFTAASLILSVSSWFVLRRSLDILTEHELDERLDDIESVLAAIPPDAPLNQFRAAIFRDYHQKDEGKWLQLIDENSYWIYFSQRARIPEPMVPIPEGRGTLHAFISRPGHHLQELARESSVNGRRYLMSMAMSTDRSYLILSEFRRNLLITVPLVILMATCAGHLLSRRALNPVAVIAKEARRINDRNLATRLPVLESGDEIQHLSTTLNQMLERIENAFRSVRSFTANASHELRTPTALIRTRTDIALCFPRSAEYYCEVLQRIQHESEQMTVLIENLLAFARADAGAEEMELQPFDLVALLDEVRNEWSICAEEFSLKFEVSADSKSITVLGNRAALHRLLRILVDNGCQYTPAGGSVHLSVRSDAQQATVSVCDTGIGIASEHLPHIFDRFYRVPTAKRRAGRGAGLGLSLAQWIAGKHGTSISVQTTFGFGSVFLFGLPTLTGDENHLHASGEGGQLVS
jgi:heavy metal sensor kinase